MIKLTPEKPPYYENVEQQEIKYLAQLTQSGTENPTVVEQKNQIGTITWIRTAQGTYKATIATGDISLKINIIATSSNNATIISTFTTFEAGNTTVTIKTSLYDGVDWTDQDSRLNRTNIQIIKLNT